MKQRSETGAADLLCCYRANEGSRLELWLPCLAARHSFSTQITFKLSQSGWTAAPLAPPQAGHRVAHCRQACEVPGLLLYPCRASDSSEAKELYSRRASLTGGE